MSDKKNKLEIEVLDSTFAANSLRLLSTETRWFGGNSGFFLYVEIAGLSDALSTDLTIKVNTYTDQKLIDVTAQTVFCAGFAGYDTLVYRIFPEDEHHVTRIRIYVAGAN